LLSDWPTAQKQFVRVIPRDYRRVLAAAPPVEAAAAELVLSALPGAHHG
jgi:hypothetical protein